MYWFLTVTIEHKPISQNYFETKVYLILCIVSNNSYARWKIIRCKIQYKIPINTLFLIKNFLFLKKQTQHYDLSPRKRRRSCIPSLFLLSECERSRESFKTIFQRIWQFDASILINHCGQLFGFCGKVNMENVVLCNYLFVCFKFYIYHCQKKGFLSVTNLLKQIIKVRKKKGKFTLF